MSEPGRVVNHQHSTAPYIYIGRSCKGAPTGLGVEYIWGNPFVLQQESDRAGVIESYEKWLLSPEQVQLVEKAKTELKGKTLACWCAPRLCHGDVLARVAAESSEATEGRRRQLGIRMTALVTEEN